MKSTLLNMTAVLFGITLVASAGVGVVNMITAEPIAQAKQAATKAALTEVLPPFDGTTSEELTIDEMPITVYTATKGGAVTYLKQLGNAADTLKEAAGTQAESATATQAAKQKAALPTSVKDAIDNPSKLTAYKNMLKTQGQSKIAKSMTKKSLKSLYDIVETRIPQIDTELAYNAALPVK